MSILEYASMMRSSHSAQLLCNVLDAVDDVYMLAYENSNIVNNTDLKGHLNEILGYNQFRHGQTLLYSATGVGSTVANFLNAVANRAPTIVLMDVGANHRKIGFITYRNWIGNATINDPSLIYFDIEARLQFQTPNYNLSIQANNIGFRVINTARSIDYVTTDITNMTVQYLDIRNDSLIDATLNIIEVWSR